MALDEALLRSRLRGEGPPTVRFYAWAPPTVSLGYGQPLDGVDLAACARLGLGLVRRPTGGSALLHESPALEVTYSVVARDGDFPGAGDLLETYRVLGRGLAAGLARLGAPAEAVPIARARAGPTPAFCFARTGSYEIAVRGRKLVGSAQRRQGGGFLQHGTLLLDAAPERLRAVFPGPADLLAGVTTLAAVLGRPVGFDEAVAALAAGLAEVLGPLVPGGLTDAEAALARRLVADKYGTEAWTRRAETAVPARA
jgi:lipoate-protein ligase A